MKPYYFLYFLIFFLSWLFEHKMMTEEKRRRWFICLCFIAIYLILALRHESMGIDLGYWYRNSGYLYSFDQLNSCSWYEILTMKSYLNYEKGYIIFNKLVGSIFCNHQFFLTVCAAINILPFMDLVMRKSKIPLLSVLIFLGLPIFTACFSAIRQCLAFSITTYSLRYIEDKKKFKFFLAVFLASTFHSSAWVFLAAYPIYHYRAGNLSRNMSIVILPFVYLFRGPLFSVLSKLFKDNAEITNTGAWELLAAFILIYIYLLVFSKDADEEQNGLINLFYVSCICQIFSGVFNIAARVGWYFMAYAIIAIPNTVMLQKRKSESQIMAVLVMLAFAAFGLYCLSQRSWTLTNPYIFFWQA